MLRGRSFLEAPDITARICGICPVAYQTSAVNALESLCGVEVPEPIRLLRRRSSSSRLRMCSVPSPRAGARVR